MPRPIIEVVHSETSDEYFVYRVRDAGGPWLEAVVAAGQLDESCDAVGAAVGDVIEQIESERDE
jgi:hypothetical protein